jgi:hypothetical protein
MAGPLISCLLDKNKEVRLLTENVINICLQNVEISFLKTYYKDLKPALKRQV